MIFFDGCTLFFGGHPAFLQWPRIKKLQSLECFVAVSTGSPGSPANGPRIFTKKLHFVPRWRQNGAEGVTLKLIILIPDTFRK